MHIYTGVHFDCFSSVHNNVDGQYLLLLQINTKYMSAISLLDPRWLEDTHNNHIVLFPIHSFNQLWPYHER